MSTLSRRLLTVPGVLVAFAVMLLGAPLWAPLLVAVGAGRRRRFAGLRLGGFALAMLGCESAGLAASAALWLWHAGGRRDPAGYAARNFALQCRWAGALARAGYGLFALRLRVEPGGEPPASGPLLVLMRHASLADTLLPAVLFSIPHGIRLRYVLKRELLWDPCLDVVGQRLPNAFVARGGEDSEAAIASVDALARELGPRDGVLIYPEGTRFTPERRERAIARLRARGESERLALAESLRRLLPPRPGGVLALLERFAERGAGSVVVCGHTGFEDSARAADLWNGRLVGRQIQIRCWTTPAAALPADRRAWLERAWRQLDAWLAQTQVSPPSIASSEPVMKRDSSEAR